MTEHDAAAVVFADAPRPGLCKKRLEPLLGAERCAALQSELIRRAFAWASAVGTPYVAFTPDDARAEFEALCPGARLVEQPGGELGARLAAVTSDVFEAHGGPVVLVGVDTPQIKPDVGLQALEDLRTGVDATFGATAGGGYYLVGLREPQPEVFALPPETWGGPEVFERTLAAAHAAGLSLAMLRAERALDDEEDARAMLADPLTPPEIARLLRPG